MEYADGPTVLTGSRKIMSRIAVDVPDLDIDPSCVMVLKGVGPRGYPGMAEVGNVPLPKKLLERGVRDMVRISDGRMSGTFSATLVKTGDEPGPGPNVLRVRGSFVVSQLAASR